MVLIHRVYGNQKQFVYPVTLHAVSIITVRVKPCTICDQYMNNFVGVFFFHKSIQTVNYSQICVESVENSLTANLFILGAVNCLRSAGIDDIEAPF